MDPAPHKLLVLAGPCLEETGELLLQTGGFSAHHFLQVLGDKEVSAVSGDGAQNGAMARRATPPETWWARGDQWGWWGLGEVVLSPQVQVVLCLPHRFRMHWPRHQLPRPSQCPVQPLGTGRCWDLHLGCGCD